MNEQIKPAPLMGATLVVGSDRYPMTIVYATDKLVGVVNDKAIRVDNNGPYSEDQEYTYTTPPGSDPNRPNQIHFYSLRKNGRWVKRGADMNSGSCLVIGHRRAYLDPSY